MKKIYIADDEQNIRSLIQSFLNSEGYETEAFEDGTALYDRFKQEQPDLVILDIMMPGMDGLNLCAAIRQESQVPIIIVSAKDSPLDRVNGISLGSDDYLVKPFLPLELIARVKSLFRRADMTAKAAAEHSAKLFFCNLLLDREIHSVMIAGEVFQVTPTEYAFLEYMMERGTAAVSKKELLKEVWKLSDYDMNTRLADDMVKRLRKKLKEAGSLAVIETIWGFGFRLTSAESGELG